MNSTTGFSTMQLFAFLRRNGLSGRILSTQFKHAMIKLIISPLLQKQIFVVPALHNLSMFQYHDRVSIAHRTQTMGDHKYCTPFHQLIHSFLNQGFCPGIDGRSGLIQNQYRRIGHCRPGDSQKLSLPLGQVGAVPCDYGVISLGKTPDRALSSPPSG